MTATPPTGDRERPEDVISAALGRTEFQFGMRYPSALAALDALVADKAASDDVIEALAARITELEAAFKKYAPCAHDYHEGSEPWTYEDCIEADLGCGHWCDRCRILAADPEGGPTDG